MIKSNLPIENYLFGLAIGGLALTIPLSGYLPQWGKTIGLSTSFLASAGLVTIEGLGKNWRRFRNAQLEIQRSVTESQYGATDSLNTATADMQYQQALKDWILTLPIEHWEHQLRTYGLAAISLLEIAAAREAMGLTPPPMLELEAEVIPKPDFDSQLSVTEQYAQDVENSIDVDWFAEWGKRSGIVCGESQDGKSFLLVNVVLTSFLKENGKSSKVYICDPDYGSAHEGQDPNTWLDLPVGKVVYIDVNDIYKCVLRVSKIVDERATETSITVQNKQPKPVFEPVLLIVDEEPMVAARLTDEQLSKFVDALTNILNRGIKQNVTFKMGSQTLAVGAKGKGGTRLQMDILRKVEMVLLWRAAQSAENYKNLDIRPDVLKGVMDELLPLPKILGSKRLCVTYLDKQLQIAGIPTVKAVQIEDDLKPDQEAIDLDADDASDETPPPPSSKHRTDIKPRDLNKTNQMRDTLALMQAWYDSQPSKPSDDEMVKKWGELHGRDCSEIDETAIAYLRNMLEGNL